MPPFHRVFRFLPWSFMVSWCNNVLTGMIILARVMLIRIDITLGPVWMSASMTNRSHHPALYTTAQSLTTQMMMTMMMIMTQILGPGVFGSNQMVAVMTLVTFRHALTVKSITVTLKVVIMKSICSVTMILTVT